MFENMMNFFKRFGKNEKENSKNTAKERLHLVLAQDRANISADFLEMMKQEIIEVIKKYIDIDEEAIDVRMTNKPGEDGTVGAPALYANIPIVTIKNEARKTEGEKQENKEDIEDNEQVEKENETVDSNIEQEDEEIEEIETQLLEEDNQEEQEDEQDQEEEIKEIEKSENNQEQKSENISNTSNTEKEKNNVKEDKNEKKNS